MNLGVETHGNRKNWSDLKASESERILRDRDQPNKPEKSEQPAYTRVYVMGTS